MADDGALQPARTRLEDAVIEWVNPKPDQNPLYQQLVQAIRMKRALGNGRFKSCVPLWVAALDIRNELDTVARREYPRLPPASLCPTVGRLAALVERKWRPQDTDRVVRLAGDLERLAKDAARLLDPPTQWFLPDPCPRCKQTHSYRRDDTGTYVRRPALELTGEYCRCGNPDCDGYWPADRLRFLGQLLGRPKPEGVIAWV